jgi:hypothetical protein
MIRALSASRIIELRVLSASRIASTPICSAGGSRVRLRSRVVRRMRSRSILGSRWSRSILGSRWRR